MNGPKIFPDFPDAIARAAAVRAEIAEAVPGHILDHPDCRLIILGSELVTAWAAEIRVALRYEVEDNPEVDAAHAAAYRRSAAVVAQIEVQRPRTIVGIGIKAIANSWCTSGDIEPDLDFAGYVSTDERLAAAVRREVHALDAAALGRAEP